jgi:hypothetical protein
VGRRGVAATLVSFLVFTALLLANAALYSSANSGLRASVTSAEQVRESALGGVLTGLSTYDALVGAQGYMQSNPLDCSSPQQYLGSMAGSLQGSGSEDGIEFATRTSWAYIQDQSGGAGSPYLRQLSGYQPGELNLEVVFALNETYNGGLPSYSTVTEVAAHLPVPVPSLVSGCLAALSDLRSALFGLSDCNSSGVDSALDLSVARYPLLASYSVGAAATPGASGCAVSYWVTTVVGGLEGVSGAFQLTVRGEGSLVTEGSPESSPSLA